MKWTVGYFTVIGNGPNLEISIPVFFPGGLNIVMGLITGVHSLIKDIFKANIKRASETYVMMIYY